MGKKSIRIYKERDGAYRGNCTITYETFDAAREAVKRFSSVKIRSADVTVKFARMKNAFPGDPNYEYNKDSLTSGDWICPK